MSKLDDIAELTSPEVSGGVRCSDCLGRLMLSKSVPGGAACMCGGKHFSTIVDIPDGVLWVVDLFMIDDEVSRVVEEELPKTIMHIDPAADAQRPLCPSCLCQMEWQVRDGRSKFNCDCGIRWDEALWSPAPEGCLLVGRDL